MSHEIINKNSLEQTLRDRITALGLTQMEIANATGIAQSTVGRFMRGECSITIRNYEAILTYTRQVGLVGRSVPANARGE